MIHGEDVYGQDKPVEGQVTIKNNELYHPYGQDNGTWLTTGQQYRLGGVTSGLFPVVNLRTPQEIHSSYYPKNLLFRYFNQQVKATKSTAAKPREVRTGGGTPIDTVRTTAGQKR